ncbi:MAG TPA: thioesterase family protein, partial [Gammaproteobacteria bacterium]|nr:thioesterase family protein [Gammaproteobacteria bacterium]
MITVDLTQCKLLSTHLIPMRWVDMDAYQHMNNARYFDYMAEARVIFFQNIMKDPLTRYVLVHVACDFKKPLVYPKTIFIKQYFTGMTRTTFTFHHTFHDHDDKDSVCALGESVIVCVDAHTSRPVIVPDNVRQL